MCYLMLSKCILEGVISWVVGLIGEVNNVDKWGEYDVKVEIVFIRKVLV